MTFEKLDPCADARAELRILGKERVDERFTDPMEVRERYNVSVPKDVRVLMPFSVYRLIKEAKEVCENEWMIALHTCQYPSTSDIFYSGSPRVYIRIKKVTIPYQESGAAFVNSVPPPELGEEGIELLLELDEADGTLHQHPPNVTTFSTVDYSNTNDFYRNCLLTVKGSKNLVERATVWGTVIVHEEGGVRVKLIQVEYPAEAIEVIPVATSKGDDELIGALEIEEREFKELMETLLQRTNCLSNLERGVRE